uniref:Uncharacterized protein n=1 Tax=Anguilla anguilla TaxID=7936 RepID=A0A0E9Q8T7_ANGAN
MYAPGKMFLLMRNYRCVKKKLQTAWFQLLGGSLI